VEGTAVFVPLALIIFTRKTTTMRHFVILATAALAAYQEVSAQTSTLRDLLLDRTEISSFRKAVEALGILDNELDDAGANLTIFAPTNDAINASEQFSMYMTNMTSQPPYWHYNLLASVNNHIVPNATLAFSDIFNSQTTELVSRQDGLSVSQFLIVVGGAKIVTQDLAASNGMLHVIDKVMEPHFYEYTLANLEEVEEYGPDDPALNRMSLQMIVDFVGARDLLDDFTPEGITLVGCRIRALNRLGLDYLLQTINGAIDVKNGEFMNASFKNETIAELIEYNILPRMYYREDIPDGYEELVFASNPCAHMWITKRDGRVCFNNGCQVETPDPRGIMASNGYVSCVVLIVFSVGYLSSSSSSHLVRCACA
jgi:uncharacterized surface protein with fasciclin (FAS1) repeats